MCIMSMVYDHYNPLIPDITRPSPTWPWPTTVPTPSQPDAIEALRKVIEDFKAARDAAAIVDAKTGQPDCADPSKKSLDERVSAIESRLEEIAKSLAAMTAPVVDGLLPARLTAEIRRWAYEGLSIDDIAEQYPWLTRKSVEAALWGAP